ncbi:MAG: prephenate dehydrogenase, partial [bacterium]
VPGHPVAGKERSGVAAAAADLFDGCNVALTPLARTDADALGLVRRMWRAIGARVIRMEVEAHDRALALTSHLPHVLAYAMVDLFAASADDDRLHDLVAGGFYDFTRTASSDAEMWRDICLMNRTKILRHIDSFGERLAHLRDLIERADGAALESLFAAAKESRASLAERRKPSKQS